MYTDTMLGSLLLVVMCGVAAALDAKLDLHWQMWKKQHGKNYKTEVGSKGAARNFGPHEKKIIYISFSIFWAPCQSAPLVGRTFEDLYGAGLFGLKMCLRSRLM